VKQKGVKCHIVVHMSLELKITKEEMEMGKIDTYTSYIGQNVSYRAV